MNESSTPAPNPDHPILVVDDDEIILIAIRESLAIRNYKVIVKNNPEEALELLNQYSFSVIIFRSKNDSNEYSLDFLYKCKIIQPFASRVLITGVQNFTTLIKAINYCHIYKFLENHGSKKILTTRLIAPTHTLKNKTTYTVSNNIL